MIGIYNLMKKIVFIILVLSFVSCKEQVIQQPEHLMEKEVMVDMMYDLAILNAIKYQNLSSLKGYNTNELEYIYNKYKIDSTQFVENNNYYTSNYKEYKKMFDQVTARVNANKTQLDSIISRAEKKKNLSVKKEEEISKDTLGKKKSITEKLLEGAKEQGEGVLD